MSDELYTDLTLESLPGAEYKETYWGGTQIFRSPVVSWLYERGWRQNFSGFGFPGSPSFHVLIKGMLHPLFRYKIALDFA